MKTLSENSMEDIQGGGFWATLLAGAACGAGLAATVGSAGAAVGAAYLGCAAALAAVAEL